MNREKRPSVVCFMPAWVAKRGGIPVLSGEASRPGGRACSRGCARTTSARAGNWPPCVSMATLPLASRMPEHRHISREMLVIEVGGDMAMDPGRFIGVGATAAELQFDVGERDREVGVLPVVFESLGASLLQRRDIGVFEIAQAAVCAQREIAHAHRFEVVHRQADEKRRQLGGQVVFVCLREVLAGVAARRQQATDLSADGRQAMAQRPGRSHRGCGADRPRVRARAW